MTKRNIEILVGLFVLMGLAALLLRRSGRAAGAPGH